MWNMFSNEFFVANDGTRIEGPQSGLRVTEFPGTGLLGVQTSDRMLEISGETVEDFGKVVKKNK